MNIAAVVVWYNPTSLSNKNTASQRIKTYSCFVDKVYIIDNSESDNSKLASEIINAEYYFSGKNLGIAAALNIGCKKALEAGYEWCITMDQDSYWDNNEFEIYIESIKKILNKNDTRIVSFSPRLKMPIKSMNDIFVNILRPIYYRYCKPPEYENLDRCITSGNIIKLITWQEISGFDERLFIDGVDFDFCFRLQEKGYKIVWVRTARMNHSIGDDKFRLFRHNNHNDFRLYYMIRNSLYLSKRFPNKYYFALDFKYYLNNCLFTYHPKNKYKLIKKAETDAKLLIDVINQEDDI